MSRRVSRSIVIAAPKNKRFWKVSALVYLLYKFTIRSSFSDDNKVPGAF